MATGCADRFLFAFPASIPSNSNKTIAGGAGEHQFRTGGSQFRRQARAMSESVVESITVHT